MYFIVDIVLFVFSFIDMVNFMVNCFYYSFCVFFFSVFVQGEDVSMECI